MLAVFFSFMSLGIFFWYMDIYMQTIRGDSLIKAWSAILAADNSRLRERLLRRLARPSRTGSKHHRHRLLGHDRHQHPLGHHSDEADLLGHGLFSNVLIRLHDRLDHHQRPNHRIQCRTHEASRRGRIARWHIAQLLTA